MDLFASPYNCQVPTFCSWIQDESAFVTNAFSIHWGSPWVSFVNAPWSLLLKILQKVASDQAEVRCITPYWTQQPWWPLLLSLATDHPRLIPEFPDLLQVPQDQDSQGRPARLPPSTRLIAWKLSGVPSMATGFRRALWHTSQQRGAAATKIQNWRLYRYVPSRRSSRCQYY